MILRVICGTTCQPCHFCVLHCHPLHGHSSYAALQGSIVRTIKRLHDLMRHAADALQQVQQKNLAQMLMSTCERLNRDILFSASLYL